MWVYSAVIMSLYCDYSIVILLRLHYSLQDVNLAYLLVPFLYINLILFLYMIDHVPVDTYWTRYI